MAARLHHLCVLVMLVLPLTRSQYSEDSQQCKKAMTTVLPLCCMVCLGLKVDLATTVIALFFPHPHRSSPHLLIFFNLNF